MWSSLQDSEILKTFKKFYVQLIEHFTSLSNSSTLWQKQEIWNSPNDSYN